MIFKDITLSDIPLFSMKLSKLVEESGYTPEHILFVERVGIFIGYHTASYFDCPISGIVASRDGSVFKSRMRYFLRYLPNSIKHFLRKIENESNFHTIKGNRNVYIDDRPPPKEKKLLIVDDAVDTGNSLKSIFSYMLDRGYSNSNLKTAVLTTTKESSTFQPNFSLFEQCILTFPWSYDSAEYAQAWKTYSNYKNSAAQVN